ncbi:orfA [Lachnospiraceae bacterium TWA4]|nr:orfA [Lachnospiraceae bacterium TWA4]
MSQKHYEPEFKKKLIRLHIEEGRSYPSLSKEYGVAKFTILTWCNQYIKECQEQAVDSKEGNSQLAELDLMRENLRLKKELEEARKENLFLKKAAAFFAKEID